ncbi:hypothetical protein JRI60_21580 [Archangium violaceum]|uniref:hypothetical protein n=1 Tax=Archangium violaceum TaxID=83451 RepID=UPI0019522A1E|nr:hypothetical protein [Archangium violaceum]QRO01422.1 hypothetical protein JRI60_21580 [Archangium violaceum]
MQPPSRIGKADLEQARVLLSRARNDLESRQWEALNRKLTATERAFERFSRAAKATGRAAEVSRGAEGFARAGRVKTLAEALPRVGPLLAVLLLLYPSSTAPAEIDRRPAWVDAQWEYEARLRDVAEESRRLVEELAHQESEEAVPDPDSDLVAAVATPTDWRTRINPATGKNYSSEEEYERVPRYPNQTCKNSLLDKLEAEKDQLTKEIPRYDPKVPNTKNEKKLDKVPCSRVRLRLEATKKVLEKRWEIQKKCFGGKPDPGHNTAMTQLEEGLADLKALEAKNCAPGHPMSEL